MDAAGGDVRAGPMALALATAGSRISGSTARAGQPALLRVAHNRRNASRLKIRAARSPCELGVWCAQRSPANKLNLDSLSPWGFLDPVSRLPIRQQTESRFTFHFPSLPRCG